MRATKGAAEHAAGGDVEWWTDAKGAAAGEATKPTERGDPLSKDEIARWQRIDGFIK